MGFQVRKFGWPAFRASAPDLYASYLILCEQGGPLTDEDLRTFHERGYRIDKVEDTNVRSLHGLLKPESLEQLLVYELKVEGDRARQSLSLAPGQVARLTEADDVVLPWNEPTDVTISGSQYRLVGLSIPQRTWLRLYLQQRECGFDFDADTFSVQFLDETKRGEQVVLTSLKHEEIELSAKFLEVTRPDTTASNEPKPTFNEAEQENSISVEDQEKPTTESNKSVDSDPKPDEPQQADEPQQPDPKPDEPQQPDPKPDEPQQTDPKTDEPQQADPKPDEPQQPDPKPDEPQQTDPKPDEPQQTDPKPDEPQQPDPKPDEPQQTDPKPDEPQQADPKPDEPQQTDPKPDEPQQTDPKPDEPQQTDPKPDEPQQPDPKPDEPQQPDPKPDEPQQADPKPDEPQQAETKSDAIDAQAPAASLPVAVVPMDLLAHLTAELAGKVEFDPQNKLFVAVPRETLFDKARLYADTIDEVPTVVEQLRSAGFAIMSEVIRIREIHQQDHSLQLLVLIVGAGVFLFGTITVVSVLLDSTERKRGTIGILRVMGVSRLGVFYMVFFRSAIIGVFAAAVTILLGFVTAAVLEWQPPADAGWASWKPVINVIIQPTDILVVVAGAITCCTLGSVIPANKASRMDPFDAIIEGRFR